MILLLALLAQAGSVDIELHSNLAADIEAGAGRGAARIGAYAPGKFAAPEGARTITIRTAGCLSTYRLSEPIQDLRSQFGPVRLYLGQDMDIYMVPDDLELETPVAYLKFRQPGDFPVRAENKECGL